jgi:nucleolin
LFDPKDYAGRTLRVNFPNKGGRTGGDFSSSPPPRRADNNVNKLFVGNLSWSVDSDTLREVFSEHGTVVDARVVNDRDTGRSRGFGFVTMGSEDEMNEALNKLDGAVCI